MVKLASYFDGDAYIQHNPQIADGRIGLANALEAIAEAGVALQYDRIHRVVGEGNFVLTVSEGTLGDVRTAFCDLVRVENGLIAEHWDTIEAIPGRDAVICSKTGKYQAGGRLKRRSPVSWR